MLVSQNMYGFVSSFTLLAFKYFFAGSSENTLADSLKKAKTQRKLSALQTIQISEADKRSRFGAVRSIIRQIRVNEGFLGFYKGYWVSIACFAPNSALWWFFYDQYSSK